MKVKIRIILLIVQFPLLVLSQDNAIAELTSAKYHEEGLFRNYKISLKDTVRLRIIEKATQYIGVDYKWGESDEKGFDCSGYVKYVFEQFGYVLPRSSYEQYNRSRRLIESKARPGDLVFFVTSGNRISHVGIYLGNKRFIHAPSTGQKVRIESLDTGFFRKTLAGFGSVF